MKNKKCFAFSVLLIAIISCNSLATPVLESSPQATQEIQRTSTSVSTMQGTISVPNLVLRTFLTSSEGIGNGMKRLTIVMDGKNASSQWYSYGLIDMAEDNHCSWRLGGGPTLETIEGYSYKPVIDYHADCGPKVIKLGEPVPPGVAFAWTGDDFNDNQGWWGWVQFDIPQNATPKDITFPYAAFDMDWKYITSGSVTTPVLPFNETKPITDPIDPQYGLKVYKAGDEINFGSLAKLNFQLGPDQSEDTKTVTFVIKSLDQGYPLEINIKSYTYLLYQDGVLCCGLGMEDWGWTTSQSPGQGTIIGPSLSGTLQTNIIMRNGKVWIIGNITIQEAVQNGQSENQIFVLQIP